jgi:hypothetical protein
MGVLGYILIIWLAIIVLTIRRVVQGRWHEKVKLFLFWSLFPFPLIIHPKRFGCIKSWLLFLISPCMMSVYYAALVILVVVSMSHTEDGPAVSIPYHTNEDLRRITGVEFPEVVPVDSTWHYDFNFSETAIKFVPVKPLNKNFFRRLDKACKDDSCCWRKDSLSYQYYIYPEYPIDRPNGTHIRQVEMNGEMIDDWDGDFISVQIPFSGDTIYVSEGWCR